MNLRHLHQGGDQGLATNVRRGMLTVIFQRTEKSFLKTQLTTLDVALTLSLSLFLQPPRKIRAIALSKAAIKITKNNDDDQVD